MILERVFDGARHLLGEAIKVRAKPREVTAATKPAHGIALTDAPKVGRPARSFDFSQHPTRSLKEMRESSAEPTPWSNWPVVHSLGHLLDGVTHRMFGSASRATSESEPWIMHAENPNAVPHPAKDRGACGLCISYVAQGRGPVAPQMVEVCPSCAGGNGSHSRDCELVLSRDFGITDDQWVDLPGQVRWDEWAADNERRGFLL